MDSIFLPNSNTSLTSTAIGNANQEQEPRSPGALVEDWLNELEFEFEKLIPWTCSNRLKVILSRLAIKVHKEKPTSGKL